MFSYSGTDSYLDSSCFPRFFTCASVVDSPDEGPDELDGPREQLAEIRQDDQEQWNADYSVNYRQCSARRCCGIHMTITWKIKSHIKIIIYISK